MRGNVVRHLTALAGVALLAAGCFDSKVVLSVNPDGSATLEHTFYLKKQKGGPEPSMTTDELREIISQLGEGVTLKTLFAQPPAPPREGWDGYKIACNVADVSKLKVGYVPCGRDTKTDADVIRFEFKAGPQPVLTIIRPPINAGEDKEPGKEDTDGQMDARWEGAKIEFVVSVKGVIVTTNAEHVNAAKTGFLLFREDLGGLLKDKAALATVKAMSKIKDAEVLRTKLKDATVQKYVQMQSEPSVVVTFR